MMEWGEDTGKSASSTGCGDCKFYELSLTIIFMEIGTLTAHAVHQALNRAREE